MKMIKQLQLKILDCLSKSAEPLSISEVSNYIQIPIDMTFRVIISRLCKHGYVAHIGNRTQYEYSITSKGLKHFKLRTIINESKTEPLGLEVLA